MPKVYDWNGTAATQIKKIYDWNGTAATQLKKGYDHDGTTSRLIYNSQYNIVTASNEYTGGWWAIGGGYVQWGTLTNNGSSLKITTTAGKSGSNIGCGEVMSGRTINMTGYNTLYFTISGYSGGFYKSRLGISTVYQAETSASGNADAFSENSAIYKTQRNVFFTANGSYSINVSDLSGGYYIYFGGVNASFGSKTFTISNMYLT